MATIIFTKRVAVLASRKPFISSTLSSKVFFSTQGKKRKGSSSPHPPEAHGPLMAGYLEFLDEILAKTEKMTASMGALHKTYSEKKTLAATVKWMDPQDIEDLFDTAGRQKKEIEETLAELKVMMEAAKKNYAVDAPDGEPDGHLQEDIEQAELIIDQAAELKKKQQA